MYFGNICKKKYYFGYVLNIVNFILPTQAIPSSRVSNGEVATNAPHVCMVLVIRPELETTDTAALGSGSIISPRHVLTAAHVVEGQQNRFIINFVVGTSRRTFNSNFALTHSGYNATNYANDIALIFVEGSFPLASIISISSVAVSAGTECTVTGHGFSSVGTIGFASINAHSAKQRLANACQFDLLEVAPSHFCAIDEMTTPRGIVCPGDNGAGLYITNATSSEHSLVKFNLNYIFS